MNTKVIKSFAVAMMVVMLTAACGTGETVKPLSAVITAPAANAEVTVGQSIQVVGLVEGSNIVRVEVVVDSKAHASLSTGDPTKGVSSFPVAVPWTADLAGAHFVQFNVYGPEDKLLGKSDAVIFSAIPAPVAPTVPPPTPTVAPIPPTAAPTAAPLTTTQTTTATVAGSPSVTVNNENGFVNVRSGPDTAYDLLGKLNQGDTAPVKGKNADGTWWQISYAAGTNGLGWVRGDLVKANDAAASVPVAQVPVKPTSPPAPPTSSAPTAAPTNVAAITATPAGPVCDQSTPDWRGANPNYPFCAKQDITWGQANWEWDVFDNGRDGPLFLTWNLYGSNISQVTMRFDQNNDICGFARAAQKTVNQPVAASGRFDFNIKDFPYGGTYKVGLFVTLTDGRTVQYGEKRLCIR